MDLAFPDCRSVICLFECGHVVVHILEIDSNPSIGGLLAVFCQHHQINSLVILIIKATLVLHCYITCNKNSIDEISQFMTPF